jgi:hypothetical protein
MRPQRAAPPFTHGHQIFVWVAMLCSLSLYVLVMKMVPPREEYGFPILVNAFLFASPALVACSLLIRGRFNERARATRTAGLETAGFLVGLAVCEAAALLGLVSWFLTGSPRSYWMVAIGFLGLLLHFPRRHEP